MPCGPYQPHRWLCTFDTWMCAESASWHSAAWFYPPWSQKLSELGLCRLHRGTWSCCQWRMQTFGSPGISRGKASKVQAGRTRKKPKRETRRDKSLGVCKHRHPPESPNFSIPRYMRVLWCHLKPGFIIHINSIPKTGSLYEIFSTRTITYCIAQ